MGANPIPVVPVARVTPRRRSSLPKLTLQGVLSEGALLRVWKVLFQTSPEQLVRDPVDNVGFAANLKVNLRQLAHIVRSGVYRPSPPIIVRSAKRDGMTRPLSFLETGDQIILKALVDCLQKRLLRDFPPCVAFSRSQRPAFGDEPSDYESWFHAWLRHGNTVQTLLEQEGCKWVVKGDIANFFPTVSHRLLRQFVSQRTKAPDELINLLFFVLESMEWRPAYIENREIGLPQENYDASRTLAHAFLKAVDDSFLPEIKENRYARWMDDLVLAAPTKVEAQKLVARLQNALEAVGLYPNAAKTKVVPVEDFQRALYPAENQYLGYIHTRTQEGKRIRRDAFERCLTAFLRLPERLDSWDRVLRRFYTEARRIGSAALERHWLRHLAEMPALSEAIFGYLAGRPFNRRILDRLTGYLDSDANIYQDVEILAYEFLLDWRVPVKAGVMEGLASRILDRFFARGNSKPVLSEHARDLSSLLIYKYGDATQLGQIARYFEAEAVHSPEFARYAFYVLAGTEAHRELAFAIASKFEDKSLRRLHTFVLAADTNPQAYAPLLRRFLGVRQQILPTRNYLPGRTLPMFRIVRRQASFRRELFAICRIAVAKLQSAPRSFKDELTIQFLQNELRRA